MLSAAVNVKFSGDPQPITLVLIAHIAPDVEVFPPSLVFDQSQDAGRGVQVRVNRGAISEADFRKIELSSPPYIRLVPREVREG